MANEEHPADGAHLVKSEAVSEDRDPLVIKRRMFEEWIAHRPGGTREQFETEWDAVTSVRG